MNQYKSPNSISRKEFLRLAGSSAAVAALGTYACSTGEKPGPQAKPNILYLMADQHRYDCLSSSGNSVIHTPNLDRIAAEGVRFCRAYTSTPSCTPARSGILTGLSPWHHGMLGYGRVAEGYEVELPREVRKAGYYTFGIGKMHFFPHRNLHGFHATVVDESGRAETADFVSDYRRWFKQQAPDLDPDATGIGWNSYRAAPYALPEELHPTFWTGQRAVDFIEKYDRAEPCWTVERAIKDPARDLRAWEDCTFAEPEQMDLTRQMNARKEVADSYLLEVKLGTPFFDAYAQHREGGVEPAVMDMVDNEPLFEGLRQRYVDHMVRKARVVCQQTDFEVLFIGCGWSCNSVIGLQMWRRWDRPVIEGVAEEVHAHGRLLHIHFGGKCAETIADLAAMGVDCVCPFERPPGGDISGLTGLKKAAAALGGRTTFNGNVHTVQTLVGGTPADVRREVGQVMKAFAANPRLIVGTGDQVARETPPENIIAMIDEAKRLSPDWLGGA